jgi:hypothetical protein
VLSVIQGQRDGREMAQKKIEVILERRVFGHLFQHPVYDEIAQRSKKRQLMQPNCVLTLYLLFLEIMNCRAPF